MAINTKKPSEFTDADNEAFQQKEENKSRGKVQYMEFDRDADEESDEEPAPARFWVAKPSRTQMGVIAGVAEKDPMKGNDMLINSCVLAGDLAALVDDTNMYFGLLKEINTLTEAKKKR